MSYFYKRCKCKYIRIYKPISNSQIHVACHYSVSFPDFLKSAHQNESKEGAACYCFRNVLIILVRYIKAFWQRYLDDLQYTLYNESKLQLLPTNLCGIELLRLATLLAILSSTKALSDAGMSSLCSFWLFSSFTMESKTKKPRIRFKCPYLTWAHPLTCAS